MELGILEDGGLDLPDDVLKDADWVIASIHYGQKQPRAQITRRLLYAIRNPYVVPLLIRRAGSSASVPARTWIWKRC